MTHRVLNQLCDCCALWVTNNDDSGCRGYYGHKHPYARSEIAGVDLDQEPVERDDEWTCDGCGRRLLPFANAWTYFMV